MARRCFEFVGNPTPLVESTSVRFWDTSSRAPKARGLSTYHAAVVRLKIECLSDDVGIYAVGIGTNLYLAKVAMDIQAKKMPADKDGVRIAELNEDS